MRSSWDVVVVGAGPAGSMLATLLARDGRKVVVVDATHFPRRKMCGEHLASGAEPLLDAVGVGATVRSFAVRIKRVSLWASPRHQLSIAAGASDVDAPLSISRYLFDRLLADHAVKSGVVLRLGRRVRSVMIENGEVRGVEASDTTRPGFVETLTAPVVIAADGRNSVVVKQTGTIIGRGPASIGFKRHFSLPVDGPDLFADELAMFGLSGGYVGVAPVDDGSLNLCGLLPCEDFAGKAGPIDAVIENRLATYPILRRLISCCATSEPWTTISGVRTQSARPRLRGVLYIGDAFGTIEPMTGQGMTMALAGAHLAHRMLSACEIGDGIEETTQRRFESAWRAMFRGSVRRASILTQLLRRPRLMQGMMLADRLPKSPATRLFRNLYRTLPVARARYERLATDSLPMPASAHCE